MSALAPTVEQQISLLQSLTAESLAPCLAPRASLSTVLRNSKAYHDVSPASEEPRAREWAVLGAVTGVSAGKMEEMAEDAAAKMSTCNGCGGEMGASKTPAVSFVYTLDAPKSTLTVSRLEVLCRDCHAIADLSSLLETAAASLQPGGAGGAGELLQHFLEVNELAVEDAGKFQHSLAAAFSLQALASEIDWDVLVEAEELLRAHLDK